MASVRPLRELLADLAGDATARSGGVDAYLAEHGHPDLPADLVAEAVVSYADTAPPEVAEHLAPFVTAHTAGHEEPADWFDLLASAPVDPADDLDEPEDDPTPWSVDEVGNDFGVDPGTSLDFGAGAVDDDEPDDTADDEAPTDWPSDEHVPSDTSAAEPPVADIAPDADDFDDDFDDDPSDDLDDDNSVD